jgi:hypothetical protein
MEKSNGSLPAMQDEERHMNPQGTAFASDYDGTLCISNWATGEERFDPAVLEAVRRYQEAGGLFGICTGRALFSVEQGLADKVDLDFYIVMTGAQVLDKNKRVLFERVLDRDVTKQIYDRYVVDDTVFRRLEPFISIPKIDLNKADSAAFSSLPGIGKFFSAKMVAYRDELGGYSYPEQLMDIWHFDKEKFDGLKDLVTVSPPEAFRLWSLPEKDLARHPYITGEEARAIVLYRQNTPVEEWTVGKLLELNILDRERGLKLSRCLIADP